MRKKLFAVLTGVIYCCVCVGNLPVSAVDPNFNATEFCIIAETKTDPESDIYRVYRHSESIGTFTRYPNFGIKSSRMTIEGEKTSDFVYGDILLINSYAGSSTWMSDGTEETDSLSDNDEPKLPKFSSNPRMVFIHIQNAQYAGNCRDVLETKELTLTKKKIETMEEAPYAIANVRFYFTDENGEEYYYICYYYNGDPEVDVNVCDIGDKILASVYENDVVLPLEVYPSIPQLLPGDVDGNGIVEISDVIRINRVSVGCDSLTPEQLKAGDITKDGKIDLCDSMQVLRYLVGLIDSLG